MESFDDGVYTGGEGIPTNQDDGTYMQYGYEGGGTGEPLPVQSEEYGYGGPDPIPDYAPSPLGDGAAGNDIEGKPYDLGADDEGLFTSDGPLLPDPSQMREEGTAFRDWRRQNAIYLEEKEKKEKEMRNQIIAEADEYIRQFYEKRTQNCETTKAQNREREKLYLAHQEKFHKEADQQYWKAIAELIPREVANFEKRRGGKKLEDDKKKPNVVVINGPKPGKPTDMSRMRQVLTKLKTTPPPHMIPPPKPEKDGKDAKDGKDGQDGKEAKDGKDVKDGKSGTPKGEKGATQAKSEEKPTTPKVDLPATNVEAPKSPMSAKVTPSIKEEGKQESEIPTTA